MISRTLTDSFRDLVEAAERADSLAAALDVVAADRDQWRNLAQELGAAAVANRIPERSHLMLTVTLDAATLALTKDRDGFVTAILARMHKDLMREIDRKFAV